MPSGPGLTSSVELGRRSGPGSTMTPERLVPSTGAWLTVVNDDFRRLPGVPLAAASSGVPSRPRIFEPSTVRVIVEAPGMALAKKSQAYVPSAAGTIVADSGVPVESEA